MVAVGDSVGRRGAFVKIVQPDDIVFPLSISGRCQTVRYIKHAMRRSAEDMH